MRKSIFLVIATALMVSSCGTYTGAGAYTGSMIGTILGSAVGGISGGPRGSDVGRIVGMAGGAVVGAAVGSKADEKVNEARQSAYQRNRQRVYEQQQYEQQQYDNSQYDNSGYDATGSGDDRIVFDNNTQSNYSSVSSSANSLEIRKLHYVGANQSTTLTPSCEGNVVFEVVNNTNSTIYDVRPSVRETSGNKHIFISPDARVESLPAKSAIRYTAYVKTDKSIKNGVANFAVSVAQGEGSAVDSKSVTVSTQR